MSLKRQELHLMAVVAGTFARLHMSAVQIAVLSSIGLRPGIRFREIENMVDISSTRLCFHLGTLIGAGDVFPRPEGKGRKKRYYITPQGMERLEKAVKITMGTIKGENSHE